MNSPLRNNTFRTVAYVERDTFDGGHAHGGGKKTRVSLALPADARLRHEIMPDARTGKAAPAAPVQSPKIRAIIVSEARPKILKWLQEQPAPLTTNQIADHPEMTALMGKRMSRASMHSILTKMLEAGLVSREYERVHKAGEAQIYTGLACMWSAAK